MTTGGRRGEGSREGVCGGGRSLGGTSNASRGTPTTRLVGAPSLWRLWTPCDVFNANGGLTKSPRCPLDALSSFLFVADKQQKAGGQLKLLDARFSRRRFLPPSAGKKENKNDQRVMDADAFFFFAGFQLNPPNLRRTCFTHLTLCRVATTCRNRHRTRLHPARGT